MEVRCFGDGTNSDIIQRLYIQNSDHYWFRTKNGLNWTAWKQIATSSDVGSGLSSVAISGLTAAKINSEGATRDVFTVTTTAKIYIMYIMLNGTMYFSQYNDYNYGELIFNNQQIQKGGGTVSDIFKSVSMTLNSGATYTCYIKTHVNQVGAEAYITSADCRIYYLNQSASTATVTITKA